MFRTILGSSFAARFTLVSLLTVAYAGTVEINNNLIFPWAADTVYRNWIFVPAGLQLLFVMLFGWRGVLGITFGGAAEYVGHLSLGLNVPASLFIAGSDALATWFSVELFSLVTGLRFPWTNLNWRQLPTLTALTAVVTAIALYLSLLVAGIEASQGALRDIALFILGDFLGAFVFFVVVLLIRKELFKAELEEITDRGSSDA